MLIKWDSTMLRFVLVGIVNTIFGMTIMFVLYNVFGVSYWWSSAANYFFGSILSFVLNKSFTFQHHGDWKRSALRFTLHILVCYLLAYGLAKPLALWLLSGHSKSFQENVAMMVGAVLFVVLNYLGQRFFAFRKRK